MEDHRAILLPGTLGSHNHKLNKTNCKLLGKEYTDVDDINILYHNNVQY